MRRGGTNLEIAYQTLGSEGCTLGLDAAQYAGCLGDGGGRGGCQFGNLTSVVLEKLLLPLGSLDTLAVSERFILHGDRFDLGC